jgi:hypothetical protein
VMHDHCSTTYTPGWCVRWAREQEGKPSKVARSKSESLSNEEFERMRRELAKVKTERDILKKALGYFAADPSFRTGLSHGIATSGPHAQCARSWGYPRSGRSS